MIPIKLRYNFIFKKQKYHQWVRRCKNMYQYNVLNSFHISVVNHSETGKFSIADPENGYYPELAVSFEDISKAHYCIRGSIRRTSCKKSNVFSNELGCELYFKKEFDHVTGSFKERGARNALVSLTQEQKRHGVVAASAGNHALALAYHGMKMDIHEHENEHPDIRLMDLYRGDRKNRWLQMGV